MPTSRQRHAITETDDITKALEIARRTWPDLAHKPEALLRRLILVGGNALAQDHAAAAHKRRQAVDETSGALAGVLATGYLDELRADWHGGQRNLKG